MIGLDTIDKYTMKARVFPAAIALAPALALAVAYVSWDSFSLSDAYAAIASIVLLVVFADISRRHGKRLEKQLLKEWGGLPSTHMFRHADSRFDTPTKKRYLTFISQKMGEDPPSEEDEVNDLAACDAFYNRCVNWLRENTSDKERFSLLLEENINYGFRRNLLGLKGSALIVSLTVVLIAIGSLLFGMPIDASSSMSTQLALLVGFAGIHSAYFMMYVTDDAVSEAAELYARQLILSCEKHIASSPAR
ncbi:hypothetical protein QEH59_11815 [Coraliomargarita sp. SDUM461004]|uniref:MotA/TolQ/ExbB proton channel domain-containing protein n=1 Tax=Thalassobacterium sedimentorum TaxID=3041258 RepID=A0ABU1AJW8_9BACT|nr:hypothetical protein [Coraliomargarita sp. SDUM461004]MDQ8195116.1 hypothetical protein [Coraliomargarita sp. SDUM461004]